jgi:hypothetical protein
MSRQVFVSHAPMPNCPKPRISMCGRDKNGRPFYRVCIASGYVSKEGFSISSCYQSALQELRSRFSYLYSHKHLLEISHKNLLEIDSLIAKSQVLRPPDIL